MRRCLFHRQVKQHGGAEKSLQERVVQFVHDARSLSRALLSTNIVFEIPLPLAGQASSSKRDFSPAAAPFAGPGIRAASGETVGVNGANPISCACSHNRMAG